MNCSLILLIFYTIWSYPNLSVSIFYFVWKFTLKKIKLKKGERKKKKLVKIFTHPPIIVGVYLTYLRRWESKFAIIGDIATLHLDRTTLDRFCPTNNFRLWSWALLLENSTARVLAPPQVASSPDIPRHEDSTLNCDIFKVVRWPRSWQHNPLGLSHKMRPILS